jgi:prlF antitoxin for toxin YhaV_toxin
MSYTARATTSGTAPAIAFSRAFAREHPEFTRGRFEAHVIAPGRLLLTVPMSPRDEDVEGADPVLETFLSFLDQQMRAHPETIRPLTARDLEGVDELLERVEVDLNEAIDGDFVLP